MEKKKIVENDFGITFSTINGSGSTTANNTILKAIFKMGIPVSARNIFPSNIQGMPTWYSLRVNQEGYLGRLEHDDILVEMNPSTLLINIGNLNSNGVLLINNNIQIPELNKELIIYQMPVDELLKVCEVPSNLAIYLANMVYVGVLAWLIQIDLGKIETALDQHFSGKRSAIDLNLNIIKKSYQWAQDNITKTDHFLLKSGDSNDGKIMVDGNTAAALGALYGGLQFAAWYPITPATSLSESLNEYIAKIRTEPETGICNCAVIQAEDELAALGMVVGAGWAGLRSMTATSGPGLCLMAEFLGLAYFAEIPVVVWDIQRVGPSTGIPTHTSQGDLTFTYFISHGDKDFIILLPATVNECFEFGWKALDIAEKLQTPVIILSDLDLGMNIWMADKFKYPDEEMDRGKVLWEKGLDKFKKRKAVEWGRYLDVDRDGIPYRTVPGNLHPDSAYFTRGTGHDEFAHYSEDAQTWEENLIRLKSKMDIARKIIPVPVEEINDHQENAVISFGSTHLPVIEALIKLGNSGEELDYLRVRGIPFNQTVKDFIDEHNSIYVVENNRDGQMMQILCIEFPNYAGKFIRISRCDGYALSAEWIIENILESKKRKAK